MMKNLLTLLLLSTVLISAAQTLVPVDSRDFVFFEREPKKLVTHKGKDALYLNGKAFLKNIPMRDGILEVEFTASKPRSFGGFIFRASDEDNYEAVYVRLHKSTNPDAIQYNPEYNGEANWQLYGEHQAFATFNQNEWNKLRIEIRGSQLKVFLNDMTKPTLELDNLRHEVKAGFIGFYSFLGAYFTNFRYKAFEEETPVSPLKPAKPGIIGLWELSEPRLVAKVDKEQYPDISKMNWKMVKAEPSGLLPINKYVQKGTAGSFEGNKDEIVWARHLFNSSNATTKQFYFDYSDNIEVFLNGQLIFSGKNSFRYKGLTFRGDVRLEGNLLYLPLKEGENEILCAVSDRANGWGLMGRLMD